MINGLSYNELAAECHANNSKWWHDLTTGERLDRDRGELLMLIVSEISEAMEGERRNLMDDKIPHRKMAEVELADAIIRIGDFAGGFNLDLDEHRKEGLVRHTFSIENKGMGLLHISREIIKACGVDEDWFEYGWSAQAARHLVSSLIMIRRYASKHGHDIDGAYADKTAFNRGRADHTVEARLAKNGKKW